MKAGEGIELKTEKDFHTFVEKIDYIFAQYKKFESFTLYSGIFCDIL